MEGFLFSPYNYNCYPGRGPYNHGGQKFKNQNWTKKTNVYVGPEAVDYLDFYKCAQLRAILSQVNPNLTPRLRKANTKDFGVQVNPKVDAVVQCSLGPKTLFYRERKWFPPVSPRTSPILKNKLSPSTPVNNVRFSRPIAIYSPVFDRRFLTLPGNEDEEPVRRAEEPAGEGKPKSVLDKVKHGDSDRHVKEISSSAPRKFNFQFLEQKYGFFHCGKCNVRWESAYVWCISGTNKAKTNQNTGPSVLGLNFSETQVYFKQLCRKCQVGFNPYKVESIQCQACGLTCCSCEKRERHIDMRRPHRQDLCGRCQGKKLSCDTTYSFKYIV